MRDCTMVKIALAASALASGCGTDCLSIARKYANESPNALICDPTSPNPCGTTRPVISWAQNGQQLTLEGLSICNHSMNAARVARLDQILEEFNSNNCKRMPTPFCPTPADICGEYSSPPSPGHYTCGP